MALSLKNISVGFILAGVMVIALTIFGYSWAGELGIIANPDTSNINAEVNDTLTTMYAHSQEDENTLSKSTIYSGTGQINLISAEPYTVLKNALQLPKLAMNTTAEISKFGLLPDWMGMFLIAALLTVLVYLFLAAIFGTKV